MFAISTCGFCFVRFCYAEVALPELLKSLTSQFSRALLARRNLCTAASRASGLAAKIMMKHEVQFSVLSVFCGIPMCLKARVISKQAGVIRDLLTC